MRTLLDLIDSEILAQDVSDSDDEITGATLLHVAAKKGNIRIFDLVLASWGSVVNGVDSKHNTILSHCIVEGNKALCQHLHIKLTSSELSRLYEELDNLAESPASLVNTIMAFYM